MTLTRPVASTLLAFGILAELSGCGSLDSLQSQLIFQPTTQADPGESGRGSDFKNFWINFTSTATGTPVRLHALWYPAADEQEAPVVLYLHGARRDILASSFRIRQLQALGFSVLGIDYRGFGHSTATPPRESLAYEDAQAAWEWLAEHAPHQRRFIYGHSLGGAIAIELASRVRDESGTMVEGSFTSIPEVYSSFRIGWLPLTPLITQRFAAVDKVAQIGSPLLVIHGSADRIIDAELGQRLYAAAQPPKRFVLVEGGTHRNAQIQGLALTQKAMAELFDLKFGQPN